MYTLSCLAFSFTTRKIVALLSIPFKFLPKMRVFFTICFALLAVMHLDSAYAERLNLVCGTQDSNQSLRVSDFQVFMIDTSANVFLSKHIIIEEDSRRGNRVTPGSWYEGALGTSILPFQIKLQSVNRLRGVMLNPKYATPDIFMGVIDRQRGHLTLWQGIRSRRPIPCIPITAEKIKELTPNESIPQFRHETPWRF